MKERSINIINIFLVITLSALALGFITRSFFLEDEIATLNKAYNIVVNDRIAVENELETAKKTLNLYKPVDFNTTKNQYAVALAYCSRNVLLINIEGRNYYEALESFNHEWVHCRWKEHYDSYNWTVEKGK